MDLYVIRMFRIIYFSGNMAPPGQHIVRRFAQTSSPWCSKSWCQDDVMLMSRCVPDVLVLQSPSSQQCFSSNAQISVISFKISCPPYQTSWYHSLGFYLMTPFLVLFDLFAILFLRSLLQSKGWKPDIFFNRMIFSIYYCFMEKWEIRLSTKCSEKNKEYKEKSFSRLAFSIMPINKKYVFSSSLICIFSNIFSA